MAQPLLAYLVAGFDQPVPRALPVPEVRWVARRGGWFAIRREWIGRLLGEHELEMPATAASAGFLRLLADLFPRPFEHLRHADHHRSITAHPTQSLHSWARRRRG